MRELIKHQHSLKNLGTINPAILFRTSNVKSQVRDIIGLIRQKNCGISLLKIPLNCCFAEVKLRPWTRPVDGIAGQMSHGITLSVLAFVYSVAAFMGIFLIFYVVISEGAPVVFAWTSHQSRKTKGGFFTNRTPQLFVVRAGLSDTCHLPQENMKKETEKSPNLDYI